jgi:electron transport complex protein RnfB
MIREDECIGCTKCIQACPTDAIIGSSKFMHSVITDACTGCGLCVIPCPVDCISLLPISDRSEIEQQENEKRWDKRREQHDARVNREKVTAADLQPLKTLTERKIEINDAVARVKAKKIIGSGDEPTKTRRNFSTISSEKP